MMQTVECRVQLRHAFRPCTKPSRSIQRSRLGRDTHAVPQLGQILLGLGASLTIAFSQPVSAQTLTFRLPPLDSDPNRCERGFIGNTIGQANAVSDKVLDLRKCVYSGRDLSGKTLAGALLADADLSNSLLREAVLTKSYAVNSNLSGADMTNAVVDRVDFSGADLSNATLVNAIITGTTFTNANLAGANFEDALIGSEDVKRLCENPTLKGDSRYQVGCRAGK